MRSILFHCVRLRTESQSVSRDAKSLPVPVPHQLYGTVSTIINARSCAEPN